MASSELAVVSPGESTAQAPTSSATGMKSEDVFRNELMVDVLTKSGGRYRPPPLRASCRPRSPFRHRPARAITHKFPRALPLRDSPPPGQPHGTPVPPVPEES